MTLYCQPNLLAILIAGLSVFLSLLVTIRSLKGQYVAKLRGGLTVRTFGLAAQRVCERDGGGLASLG